MTKKRRPGRPPGSLEDDHETRKAQILDKIAGEVFQRRRLPALKGLAEIAGVSVSTLIHYFHDRDTLCAELLAYFGRKGEDFHLPKVRTSSGPLHAIHEFGFVESLCSPLVAEKYITHILDTTSAAVAEHIRRGEYASNDPSRDAIVLASSQPLRTLFLANTLPPGLSWVFHLPASRGVACFF